MAVDAFTSEMGAGTNKLCSSVRCSHQISFRQTPVSFRKDQRIHVGNVNIVIPFCCWNEPSFSSFEMQNQSAFNFWGSFSHYLRATQATPATVWESSGDFNSAGPPSGPCGHQTEPPIRWPATNAPGMEGLLLKDTVASLCSVPLCSSASHSWRDTLYANTASGSNIQYPC